MALVGWGGIGLLLSFAPGPAPRPPRQPAGALPGPGPRSSIDLQIDWQTGTWTLAVPDFQLKTQVYEKWDVYDKKLQMNNHIQMKEETRE